jgi:hypothetical protein
MIAMSQEQDTLFVIPKRVAIGLGNAKTRGNT